MADEKKRVAISILGRPFEVPPGDTLLRALQFLEPAGTNEAGFCWVTDCRTCEVLLKFPSGEVEWVLACETPLEAGMDIVDASEKVRACLKAPRTFRGGSRVG
jgi:hypothetical protein